jgi:predicted nucleic acid-binding protein
VEVVKTFIADTVGLARYLEDNLPGPASDVFSLAERGEASILVPQIVMGEFIYIGMKGRLRLADPKSAVKQVLDELRATSFIFQSNFPEDGWDIFLSLDIPELHDRLIAAEALSRSLSLISNDPVFLKVHGLNVIWEKDLSNSI